MILQVGSSRHSPQKLCPRKRTHVPLKIFTISKGKNHLPTTIFVRGYSFLFGGSRLLRKKNQPFEDGNFPPQKKTNNTWWVHLPFRPFRLAKPGRASHSKLAFSRVSFWLVVEPTHLKNMLVKMGSSSPRIGVKLKNI